MIINFTEYVSISYFGNNPPKLKNNSETESHARVRMDLKTLNIDRVSRIIFPVAFAFFNIGYAWYYTRADTDIEEEDGGGDFVPVKSHFKGV